MTEDIKGRTATAPVCLGCLRDEYPGVEPGRVWPTPAQTCHVCGMDTEMGYFVSPPARTASPPDTPPGLT